MDEEGRVGQVREQAGLRSYGHHRKEFGFSSKYNRKLPKVFKEGVTGSDLHRKRVSVTVWKERG